MARDKRKDMKRIEEAVSYILNNSSRKGRPLTCNGVSKYISDNFDCLTGTDESRSSDAVSANLRGRYATIDQMVLKAVLNLKDEVAEAEGDYEFPVAGIRKDSVPVSELKGTIEYIVSVAGSVNAAGKALAVFTGDGKTSFSNTTLPALLKKSRRDKYCRKELAEAIYALADSLADSYGDADKEEIIKPEEKDRNKERKDTSTNPVSLNGWSEDFSLDKAGIINDTREHLDFDECGEGAEDEFDVGKDHGRIPEGYSVMSRARIFERLKSEGRLQDVEDSSGIEDIIDIEDGLPRAMMRKGQLVRYGGAIHEVIGMTDYKIELSSGDSVYREVSAAEVKKTLFERKLSIQDVRMEEAKDILSMAFSESILKSVLKGTGRKLDGSIMEVCKNIRKPIIYEPEEIRDYPVNSVVLFEGRYGLVTDKNDHHFRLSFPDGREKELPYNKL